MKIEKDKVVFINYLMKNEENETLEDTRETSPTGFLFGHGALMPAIEGALVDKEVGALIKLELSPDEAFGKRSEELVETIERSKFSKDIRRFLIKEGILIKIFLTSLLINLGQTTSSFPHIWQAEELRKWLPIIRMILNLKH